MANEVRMIDANALHKILEEAQDGTRRIYLSLVDYRDKEVCKGELGAYARVKRMVEEAPTIDPESLRPKGHWDIRCDYHVDAVTREADESFYLECSECKRKVWDVDQIAAMNGEYRKLIEQYPYCHCGCKMEG